MGTEDTADVEAKKWCADKIVCLGMRVEGGSQCGSIEYLDPDDVVMREGREDLLRIVTIQH
jgi:hypothetical protein